MTELAKCQGAIGSGGEQGTADYMPRLKEAAALQPPWAVLSGNVGPLLPAFTVLFCFQEELGF